LDRRLGGGEEKNSQGADVQIIFKYISGREDVKWTTLGRHMIQG